MNTISPHISEFGIETEDVENTSTHRHFRSRNVVEANTAAIQSTSIRGNISFDEAFISSVQQGLNAAKHNTFPAIIALCLMTLLTTAYALVPSVQNALNQIAVLKSHMGVAFPLLGMGLAVGLLAEITKVRLSATRTWTAENTKNFIFLFLMFGLIATAKDTVYVLLARIYGEGIAPGVIAKKVFFDQFLWMAFLACPSQTLLFSLKAHGFSMKSLKAECPTFSEFFALKILPVMITNWFFWIPMAAIIYTFPTNLQLAVSIIAMSLWACLHTAHAHKAHHPKVSSAE